MRTYGSEDEPIISEQEQAEIVKWVKENVKEFNINGYNRWKQHLDYFDSIPTIFEVVKQRIVKKERLHGYEQEPEFRDSVGYMFNGGKLHEHMDSGLDGKEHVRFNVYVQLPEKGGRPIYGGIYHDIKERQYICCRASIDKHEATMCVGLRARIIISYGFLIPLDKLGEVKYNY